jgi:hypothetical protein
VSPSEQARTILTPGHRLCLGCDGTGLGPEWQGGDIAWPFELCGACGGDGEVPVEQPARADALADAETLLRYLRQNTSDFAWRCRSGLALTPRFWERNLGVIPAIFAAHAAFRAVPGLRGDR